MDLTVRSESVGTGDQSWLGSAHGTDNAHPCTLARSAFTSGTHYPNGYLPAGTPVAKFTSGGSTGLYGPYTTGATNGTQTLAGFLLTDVSMTRSTTGNPQGALLEHGRVIVAKLPQTVDAAGQTSAAGRFIFA